MNDRPLFFEIAPASLNRHGEEVCGDQVKILRTAHKTIVVLSDGLGSGIKAAILARLTTGIIVTMLRDEAPLKDVIETVAGTLPVCRVRDLAYATFVMVQIQHASGRFELVSFDSPPPVLLKARRKFQLESLSRLIGGKLLHFSEGRLEQDDFIGLMTDGVLHAGRGVAMNLQWGYDAIAGHLEQTAQAGSPSAEALVQAVLGETNRLYGHVVGDDATLVGILARKPRRLIVFTGPPSDPTRDAACVERLLLFDGRRVVCGGTTGQIVAEGLGEVLRTDETTGRDGIPPVGHLPEIDLVTEGILTLARTLELLTHIGADLKNKL